MSGDVPAALDGGRAPGSGSHRSLAAVLSIALLALVSSATGLANGFAYDDLPIIVENPRVHSLHAWWHLFAETYWPPKWGAALYRPLTMLGLAAQWSAGGGRAWVFHAVNVLLYAAVCVAVWWLASLVLPRVAAWVAAALFAVHPVHVEAVANVVGLSELLVALSVVLAVALYIGARRRGALDWRSTAAVAALYVVALLSKEHGFMLPFLLLAAELTVVGDTRPLRARLHDTRPLVLLLVALALGWLLVRQAVLGGLVGESPAMGINGATSLATRLCTMLAVSREWVRLLLWPARLSVDYSPRRLDVITGFDAGLLPSVFVLLALACLTILAWRRRPVAAFGIVWTAIALFPVSNLVIRSGVLLAERTLFLPSVGAMLAVGAVAAWAVERVRARPEPALRAAAAGALALVLVLGAARSAFRAPVWRDDATLFHQMVVDAPESYRAHWGWGMWMLKHGQRGTGEREIREAIRLYPLDPYPMIDLGTMYREAGLLTPALALFRQAMTLAPDEPQARIGYIACLLGDARFFEARSAARVGIATGRDVAAYRRLRVVADSVIAARGLRPGHGA